MTSATSTTLTLFAAVSATVQYITADRVPLGYGLLLLGISIVSSVVGQIYILGYARKTGRSSLLVWSTAIILIASTILLAVAGAQAIVTDVNTHASIGFIPLCG